MSIIVAHIDVHHRRPHCCPSSSPTLMSIIVAHVVVHIVVHIIAGNIFYVPQKNNPPAIV
jgi:hypothetical protein